MLPGIYFRVAQCWVGCVEGYKSPMSLIILLYYILSIFVGIFHDKRKKGMGGKTHPLCLAVSLKGIFTPVISAEPSNSPVGR